MQTFSRTCNSAYIHFTKSTISDILRFDMVQFHLQDMFLFAGQPQVLRWATNQRVPQISDPRCSGSWTSTFAGPLTTLLFARQPFRTYQNATSSAAYPAFNDRQVGSDELPSCVPRRRRDVSKCLKPALHWFPTGGWPATLQDRETSTDATTPAEVPLIIDWQGEKPLIRKSPCAKKSRADTLAAVGVPSWRTSLQESC